VLQETDVEQKSPLMNNRISGSDLLPDFLTAICRLGLHPAGIDPKLKGGGLPGLAKIF